MIIHDREYIKPSRVARVLSLLEALASDSGLSQQELGQRSFLSGAMVNQYLREMQQQGLIRFVPENSKSYRYVLTEKGEAERRNMFSSYSSELVRLYSSLKKVLVDKLRGLQQKGIRKVALFGASETCEVALSALNGSSFEVVTVVDNDPEKHGKLFHGQIICSPAVLENAHCQAIIVTSFGFQDEICDQVASVAKRKGMEIIRL